MLIFITNLTFLFLFNQTISDNWLTFKDKENLYSIQYPSDWDLIEVEDKSFFVREPIVGDFGVDTNVEIEIISNSGVSLKKRLENYEKEIKSSDFLSNAETVSVKKIVFNGVDAYDYYGEAVVYGITMKWRKIMLIVYDQYFQITTTTSKEKFDSYFKITDKIISSFKLKKP